MALNRACCTASLGRMKALSETTSTVVSAQPRYSCSSCRLSTQYLTYHVCLLTAACLMATATIQLQLFSQVHTVSDPSCIVAHRAAARLTAAATRIQAIVRGTQQRRAYLQARQHVVCLQAAFRGYPVRMHFLQAKGAAIWIQSCWRRHQAQRMLTQIKVPPLPTVA